MSWFDVVYKPKPSPLAPLEELKAVEQAFKIVDAAWSRSLSSIERNNSDLSTSTSDYLYSVRLHLKDRIASLAKKVFYDEG